MPVACKTVPAIPEKARPKIQKWIEEGAALMDPGTFWVAPMLVPHPIDFAEAATTCNMAGAIKIRREKKALGPGQWCWVAVRQDSQEEICQSSPRWEPGAAEQYAYGPVSLSNLAVQKYNQDLKTMAVQKYNLDLEAIAQKYSGYFYGNWKFHNVALDQQPDPYPNATEYAKEYGPAPALPPIPLPPSPMKELMKLVPALEGITVACPHDCHGWHNKSYLGNMIMHLNDFHQWTRERIADWLETLDIDLQLQPLSQGD